MSFKSIAPEEISRDPFSLIGQDWLLVTAAKDGKANTMTASWGGVGIMWGKKVVTIYLRPTRYTKEFVDAGERFTLSVLPESRRDALRYLGSVSGRDEDKIKKAELTVTGDASAPYFEEATLALVCRKLYAQEMKSECFIDRECDEKWYKDDYHTMYIAEIEQVLIKE